MGMYQRALIVEDQELWREQFFGEALRELGFSIFCATNKKEAFELLDKHHFDLAIVDINLTAVTGNVDGLAVADYVKKQDEATPIIVVSGTDGGFRALQGRENQIFAQIAKDLFSLELFISQVKLATEPPPVLGP